MCRQTADTFQAAATFLELLNIWGPASPEITSKIKYAKYHALRILKAIRANEDPNLSNPAPDSGAGDDGASPSAGGDDLLPRSGAGRESLDAPRDRSLASKQATVEDEEDDGDGDNASTAENYDQHARGGTYSPAVLPSAPSTFHGASITPPPPPDADHHDLDEYYYAHRGRADNAGRPAEMGEYDDVSPPAAEEEEEAVEAVEGEDETGIGSSSTAGGFPGYRLSAPRPRAADLPSAPPAKASLPAASAAAAAPPSHLPRAAAPGGKRPPAAASALPVADDATAYTADEEAIASASKHARWAISALNFDDVKTAVKELRQALDALGVRQ
jgi:vacuolar protein sorting-associated protein VTA1